MFIILAYMIKLVKTKYLPFMPALYIYFISKLLDRVVYIPFPICLPNFLNSSPIKVL